MKLVFKLLFLLVTQFSSYSCDENLLVLGSRFVSEPNYTYYVITNGNFPSPVDVSFNDIKRSKSFSQTDIEDVFSISSLPSKNELKVEATIPGKSCKEQSVKLTRTTDLPLIFIHFAKPIYKTGEEFKFRVFFLNQRMTPYTNKELNINIVIFDSTGYAVKKYYEAVPNEFGAFNETMEIANDPNLGKWKIQVEIEGRNVSKTFEVQKYEEGDLEVVLDIASVVAHIDKRVYLTIFTKSDDGNFVNGEAAISLSARFVGSTDNQIVKENFKKIQLKDRKTVVMLDFSDDMEIRFPTSDMVLKFDVEVTENYSQKSKKVTKEVQMMHKGRNTFQIIRKKYFKPELKYPMKIRVKTVSGSIDNSFHQLKMNVKYKNGESIIDDKTFTISLKNGETSQILNPAKNATKIIVDLEFNEIKKTEEIDIFPTFGANEYMQAAVVSKNTTIGTTMKISVKSTEEMEELHLVIFGLKGIVYSKKFADAQSKDVYDVTFKLTDEMRPEARGLLFYVKPDTGAIVYDEFSISVGLSIGNSLEITTDKDALPNSETKIKIKTEPESYVYLSAIDNAAAIINLENEIPRSEIYSELTYYLNKKFPNAPKYHFEKLNAFILEPLKNGMDCGLSSRGGFGDDDNNDDYDGGNTDNDVHQYFPEVPFEKMNTTALGDYDETIKLPSTSTSWRIFGISVHKDKGFTVAKVQSEIAVKSNISLQIEAPSEIHTNEVFEVKLTAFNYLNHEVNGKIDFELKNAVFVGLSGDKCIEFKMGVQKPKVSDQKLPPNGKPQVVATFHVSPSTLESIMISATIEADSQQYTAEKIIKVWPNSKEKKKNIASSILLEETEQSVFTTIGTQNIAYGNLFGPAIDGLESIFHRSMILDEEKILNFATAVIRHKFLKLYEINDDDHVSKKKVTKAKNDMIKGYQETLPILQNILKTADKKSILILAQITKVLIDAKEFINYINQTLIDESLEFIKTQQLDDGSFPYFEDSDYHRDNNFGESRKIIQTALIIETFLQNDEVKNNFQGVIKKSLKYSLKSDYIRAISAFNFALNNDKTKAQEILSNIDNKQKKLWHNSVLCEINSYLIRTKILLQENASELVKNLLSKHRNSDGGFYSPYDTVLGLQALYEYAKLKNIQKDTVEFKIEGKVQEVVKFESVSLNISKNDKFTVTKGLGYVNIINAEKRLRSLFELNVAPKDLHGETELDMHCTISLNKTSYANIAESSKTNMIVLEAEIPRGYKYVNHIEKNMKIEKFELRKDENIAVFYINNLEGGPKYSITIKTKKVFEIRETKSLLLNIYDYYRPNFKTTQYKIQDINAVKCEQLATKNSG